METAESAETVANICFLKCVSEKQKWNKYYASHSQYSHKRIIDRTLGDR